MQTAADVHDVARDRLGRISQRYTAGRRDLVGVLAASDRPLTIPEIVEREPSLSTSSVYRNLTALEQAGVTSRIVTSTGQDHARYELAEQLSAHHHHLVCEQCGTVTDFTLPEASEAELDLVLHRVARRSGYVEVAHRLDVVGVCPDCRAG